MKVMYIMTRAVITGHPDMPVEEAKELMREHHISGLPVVDEDACVVGVFSQTDALTKDGLCVRDLMTAPAVTLEETTSIREAAALMAAKDINRIPVLRLGQLVGVVSRADIIRYVATHQAWMDPQEQEWCRLES